MFKFLAKPPMGWVEGRGTPEGPFPGCMGTTAVLTPEILQLKLISLFPCTCSKFLFIPSGPAKL